MRKIVVDPFTGQPRVEEVEEPKVNGGLQGDVGPAGPAGADGQQGATGPQGPAGEDGTVPDVAWSEDTTVTITDLFGGTVNLGTGGDCRIKWQRVGRSVEMKIFFLIGAGATFGNGGPWMINANQLPYTPLAAPTTSSGRTYTTPGGFGFYNSTGGMEMLCPAIPVTGAGSGNILFVTAPGDGGLGNLFYNGNPLPILEGDIYQGDITYEANSAA